LAKALLTELAALLALAESSALKEKFSLRRLFWLQVSLQTGGGAQSVGHGGGVGAQLAVQVGGLQSVEQPRVTPGRPITTPGTLTWCMDGILQQAAA
jgi:hypothetical protein